MRDPRRLVETSPNPAVRAALRSARGDCAPKEARALISVAMAAAVKTTAAAAAGSTVAAAGGGLLLKWTLVGVLAGGAWVAGTAYLTGRKPATREPAPTVSVSATHSSALPSATAGDKSTAAFTTPDVAPSTETLRQPTLPPTQRPMEPEAKSGWSIDQEVADAGVVLQAPVPSGALPKAPGQDSSKLAYEVALLEKARSAVASGDGARALSLLGEYDRDFPGGMLSSEATVLRIEALQRTGQHAAAVGLANSFLASHPNSPVSDRIRSLVPKK